MKKPETQEEILWWAMTNNAPIWSINPRGDIEVYTWHDTSLAWVPGWPHKDFRDGISRLPEGRTWLPYRRTAGFGDMTLDVGRRSVWRTLEGGYIIRAQNHYSTIQGWDERAKRWERAALTYDVLVGWVQEVFPWEVPE